MVAELGVVLSRFAGLLLGWPTKSPALVTEAAAKARRQRPAREERRASTASSRPRFAHCQVQWAEPDLAQTTRWSERTAWASL